MLNLKTVAAVALGACVTLGGPARAQEGGVFSNLAGSWSGSGTIAVASGSPERIRCQITYAVGGGGNQVNQALRCASDSYKVESTASVTSSGGTLSGSFKEATRGITGDITGHAERSSIRSTIAGVGFTAGLGITTEGNTQTVSIRPQSGEITSITINLKRGG